MQPGWIFGWPGIAFFQGAVQTCRELWLVQPSLELLVWQLCPWEVYHRIILKLFDFFAALLWELKCFWVCFVACPAAPSWCCWYLCHGTVTSRAFAWVTAELLKHLAPSPPHLEAGELRLCCYGQIQSMEQSLCLGFVFPAVCSQDLPCAPGLPVVLRGVCLPLGVWRGDSDRAPEQGD